MTHPEIPDKVQSVANADAQPAGLDTLRLEVGRESPKDGSIPSALGAGKSGHQLGDLNASDSPVTGDLDDFFGASQDANESFGGGLIENPSQGGYVIWTDDTRREDAQMCGAKYRCLTLAWSDFGGGDLTSIFGRENNGHPAMKKR